MMRRNAMQERVNCIVSHREGVGKRERQNEKKRGREDAAEDFLGNWGLGRGAHFGSLKHPCSSG
jgi:hypothetical protein